MTERFVESTAARKRRWAEADEIPEAHLVFDTRRAIAWRCWQADATLEDRIRRHDGLAGVWAEAGLAEVRSLTEEGMKQEPIARTRT